MSISNLEVKRLDESSAAAVAGAAISAQLSRYDGVPVLLLFSGGSALKIIDHISGDNLGEHITIAVVDERFSSELDVNNFLQIQATSFYNRAIANDVFAISTEPRTGEQPQELARRFEEGLRSWRRDFPFGVIIATLGVGADAHTAGILPMTNQTVFDKEYDDSAHWVALREVSGMQFSHRITVTLPFLRMIDHTHCYVFGRVKDRALQSAISDDAPYANLPARIIRDMKDVVLYTDSQVADAIL